VRHFGFNYLGLPPIAETRLLGTVHRPDNYLHPCGTFASKTRLVSDAEIHQGGVGGYFQYAEFRAGGVLVAVILIVEDEVFIRQNAECVIEDMGHNTLVAGDLYEALLHLSASQHIDALFVDIRLSELALGGYEVANKAIELRPKLRVLYTSGSTLTGDMTELFVEGGQFIQKPYSNSQLDISFGKLLH
jgi:CheY-like chemotaxis protein